MLEFGAVQALVQLCMAAAGLLIVRGMTKGEYALFAIANTMQTAGSQLADLGIGVGLRAIGGRVADNPIRFGQLIRTALELRWQFAVLALAATIPFAAWMLLANGASVPTVVGLCLCIGIGAIPLLGSSVFGVSLQLHAQYRRMQKLDLGNAVLRLALVAVIATMSMGTLPIMVVGVVGNWVQFLYTRRWGSEYTSLAMGRNEQDRRELLKLSIKALPNTCFFCFQGQVTLLILTFLGTPTGIADITALGRLAALLTVISLVFSNMLAPQYARCQNPDQLLRLYVILVGGAIATLAPIVLFGWLFPDPLLWLLGAHYASLKQECVWGVAAGCVSQVAGVMWALNTSKAWIRCIYPLFIPVWLTVQVVAALHLDLRDFHQILVFNTVSAGALIPVYAADAFMGIRTEMASPRRQSAE